jgi:hypothetical protein
VPTVKIEPTREHKVPFDLSPEQPKTFADEVQVAGATAELLVELGASLEVDEDTAEREKRLLEAVVKKQDREPLQNVTTAYAASAFLRAYGQKIAFDAAQARAAITAKLMEIADCGDIKFELKALELLGKHSDIGLFTERSEITVNYNNSADLESAIKEKVKRLLHADIIDVTPIGADLDLELGVARPEPKSALLSELDEEEEADDGEA